MKHLKEVGSGNLVRTTDEKAAAMVASGLFVYSTKARFKSVLKDQKKLKFQRIRFDRRQAKEKSRIKEEKHAATKIKPE
jgi:hypothetical protein